jgi:hypothetical protein
MIASEGRASFDALLVILEQRASQIADARARSAQMARSGDERRWRRPDLLWPTFVKDR